MIENLESNYDCASASQDLHQLQEELAALQASASSGDQQTTDNLNRLENQIRFIKNKCDIRP